MPSFRLAVCAALAAASLGALPARADSPLTSIDLSQGYDDVPAVHDARGATPMGDLPKSVGAFLLSDAPSDQKTAVCFALNAAQAANALSFFDLVATARHKGLEKLKENDLTPQERFVAGTLLALSTASGSAVYPGDGADVSGVLGRTPQQLLDSAATALPQDFAVQYVRALVKAQDAMEKSFCAVFKGPDAVLRRFPAAKRTLRPEALASATDYLDLYEKDCPGSKAAEKETLRGFNELYALARLGTQLVAATQSGVVVWEEGRPEPVAKVAEPICPSLVVWHDAAWAGCDAHLVRWDGKRFETLAKFPAQDGQYPVPMVGPSGALWVRHGATTKAWDEAQRTLVPVKPPWTGDAHDALFTHDGAAFWVHFMKDLQSTGGAFTLKSPAYPGADPRTLRETADGTLWVEDFDDGLFRFDPAKWAFTREALVPTKASGVAVDAAAQRLYALQYDFGLRVSQQGKPLPEVDLRRFEYCRDLLLQAPGVVWVGTTKGLVQLREQARGWEQVVYRVRAARD